MIAVVIYCYKTHYGGVDLEAAAEAAKLELLLAVLNLQAVLQHGWRISFNLDLCNLRLYLPNGTAFTAGIISLLTHICISVALKNVVHPKVTYEHQWPYHQELHNQLCNPSWSDSCKA